MGAAFLALRFSFPVCLRYELLCVRNWAYYDGFLLGYRVQPALLFVGEGFWDVYSVEWRWRTCASIFRALPFVLAAL